jgi:hypothetical protein
MTFFGAGAMRSIGLTLQTATGEGSAMPRYYFNIYNDDVTLDEEGAELMMRMRRTPTRFMLPGPWRPIRHRAGISASATASKSKTKIIGS